MFLYILSNAIVCFICLIVGIFVLLKNKKALINRLWFLFSISVSLWAFCSIKTVFAPNEASALFWGRFLYVGAVFIPSIFYHFIQVLIDNACKRLKIILISYLLSFFFLILNFTDFFIKGVSPKPPFKYYDEPGILYPLFIIFFVIFITLSILNLINTYRKSVGVKRNQLKYVIWASLIGFIGGSSSIPLVFGNIPLFFFTYPLLAIFPAIIGYAILKHRLMDIDFVLRKSAVYLCASSLYLLPLIVIVILAQKFIFNEINLIFSIMSGATILIAAYVFPKLRYHAEQTAEQYVFKNLNDYKRTIQELTKATVTILNKNALCKKIVSSISQAMDVSTASTFILDEEQNYYKLIESHGINNPNKLSCCFHSNHPFFSLLEQHGEIIIREEFERSQNLPDMQTILSTMNALEAEISIPLISKNKLLGIINLGTKRNKKMYSHEDIDLLSTLGDSAAVALENTYLVENINKTRTAMERADRLAQIGTLAAGIAHEIRNPMVAIKTSAQLLPERYEDEEFRSYFSSVVVSEIERVTKKINNLLDYARPANPFFQKENINSIIDEMVAFLKNEAQKKGQSIETILSPNLPLITVDKEQIKQVFINLILNAIEATQQNGKIFISTQEQEKANGEVDFITIQVSDTGIGIPKEDWKKIFTPYYTTKASGSGFGLATTQQIIIKHGGTIDVNSRLNEGTTFTIRLPVNPLLLLNNNAQHVQ